MLIKDWFRHYRWRGLGAAAFFQHDHNMGRGRKKRPKPGVSRMLRPVLNQLLKIQKIFPRALARDGRVKNGAQL
jgi:hypothetical protein